MKLRYFYCVALSALLFIGCSDENQRLDTFSEISLNQSFVSIPEEGGDVSVTISSEQNWKFAKIFPVEIVTGKDADGKDIKEKKYFELPAKLKADKSDGEFDWLTASQLEGPAGQTTITFHADKSEGGREAALIIQMGGKEQHLVVRQGSLEAQDAKIIDVLNGTVGKNYRVTGTVSAWYSNAEQYGNYYITDETGTIIVYGTADKDGKLKNYPLKSWGIELGDIITVEGGSTEYKGVAQLSNVTVVKLVKSLIKIVGSADETLEKDGGLVSIKVAYKGSGCFYEIADEAKNWITYKSAEFIPGKKTLFESNPADTVVFQFNVASNYIDIRNGAIDFTSSKYDDNTGKTSSSTISFTINQKGPANPPVGDGTEAAPFNVTAALAAAAAGASDVYIKGVVSKAPTSLTSGSLAYSISADGKQEDELLVIGGLSFSGAQFAAQDDIRLGDVVIIKGNLKKADDAAQIEANNQLVNLNNLTSMEGINDPGSLRKPFDVAGAIAYVDAAGEGKVFVKGVVSELVKGGFGADYGNGSFFLSDDGTKYGDPAKDFEAYQVNWVGNKKWVEGFDQIAVGDAVIIYGPLTKYNTTYETQGKSAAYIFMRNGKYN